MAPPRRRPEDVTRCDDCGAESPPYTPVALTLTFEAPRARRTTITPEYFCAACVGRLTDEQQETAG